MTSRLNARIDTELAMKLEELRRRTAKTTTEIIRESIELYYQRLQERGAGALDVFTATGFVGCAEGDEDLSSTYKSSLADSLTRKTNR